MRMRARAGFSSLPTLALAALPSAAAAVLPTAAVAAPGAALSVEPVYPQVTGGTEVEE